ncbi:MAG: AAA family ATPase [Clostridiales bacterium]|nr:AAA family ATPase [Clostridiales bacterium]
MFLKQIHVENFRLLMDYDVMLDEGLTLLVGKNNAGKTTLMNLIKMVINGNELQFDDYPIQSRQVIYQLFSDFWCGKSSFVDCVKQIPIPMVRFCIDYSKEVENDFLGGLSPFIIDLDEKISEAIIDVKYNFVASEDMMHRLKVSYDEVAQNLKNDSIKNEQKYAPTSVAEKARSDEEVDDSNGKTDDDIDFKIVSKVVSQNFAKLFSLHVLAVNPADPKDVQEKTKKELNELFVIQHIGAERGLDENENAQKKPLGAIMSRLFKSDVSDIESEIVGQTQVLRDFVDKQSLNAENKVNDILSEIIDNMVSFGYPTAEDLRLYARTQFSMESDIINNTDLTYMAMDQGEILPSSHNGLGYKNLIKITFLLKEFARNVDKSANSAIPILFLEEPEAHMHPQLQEVFVGHLESVLSKLAGNPIQIIISTHSPHIANTVSFKNVRYLRKKADRVICKNLNEFCERKGVSDKEHQKNITFLRKYLTLSRCDLYFCDKAILVEGAAERLLLSDMMKKCEMRGKFAGVSPALTSQYCSIIEVGGAYAYQFFNFLDFLEIPTLILTDIDFIGGDQKKALWDKAVNTSNATIKKWGHDMLNIAVTKKIELDQILNLTDEQKTNGLRHLEFQLEENGSYPRSLEEAIMNVNREYYGISSDEKNINFDENEKKKTDFALDLILGEIADNYQIPSYIERGLIWLNKQSKVSEFVKIKKKLKRTYTKKSTEKAINTGGGKGDVK